MNYLLAFIKSIWLWLLTQFCQWNDPHDKPTWAGTDPDNLWQWAPSWLSEEGAVLWVWRSKSRAHWRSLGINSAEDVRDKVTIFS